MVMRLWATQPAILYLLRDGVSRVLFVGDIRPCLPPDRTWHKVFFYRGIQRNRGWVRIETRVLLVYVGHSLTRSNVGQMTPWAQLVCLLIVWTRPESLVLCKVCQWRHRPPSGGPAEAGGHSGSNLSLTLCTIQHECQMADWKAGAGACVRGTVSCLSAPLNLSCYSFFFPRFVFVRFCTF